MEAVRARRFPRFESPKDNFNFLKGRNGAESLVSVSIQGGKNKGRSDGPRTRGGVRGEERREMGS